MSTVPLITAVKKRVARAAERSIKVNSQPFTLTGYSIGVFHFNLPLYFRNFSSPIYSWSVE